MVIISGAALLNAIARAPADRRSELNEILDGEDRMSLALLARVGGFHVLCAALAGAQESPRLGAILADALAPVTDRVVAQAKHGHPGPGRRDGASLRDCPINLIAPTLAQAHDRALRSGSYATFEQLAWLIARESDKEALASSIAETLLERQAA